MRMLARSVASAEFSAEEVGAAFAEADDRQQRGFLIAVADAVEKWPDGTWAVQCEAIATGIDGLTQHDRSRIKAMLQCLVDSMGEL